MTLGTLTRQLKVLSEGGTDAPVTICGVRTIVGDTLRGAMEMKNDQFIK